MDAKDAKVTIPALQQMKRDGRKIVGVVAWDYQIARIVDRVGVDVVSVGDTVGVNLWGHSNTLEVTMDQMILVCQSGRSGGRVERVTWAHYAAQGRACSITSASSGPT